MKTCQPVTAIRELGMIDLRASRPAVRGQQALLVPAAIATLGYWMVVGRPAVSPQAAPVAAPTWPQPMTVAVPAPDPLVGFTPKDRPRTAEEGLVSYVLRPVAPQASPVSLPAGSAVEASLPDKRLSRNSDRTALPRLLSQQEPYSADKARSRLALWSAPSAELAQLVKLARKKNPFPKELWFKGLNSGKPVCRSGGQDCIMPDGTLFRLESIAQYNELEARGLVVFPSPLVFDLDGDGARTSAGRVRFDINGDGIVDDLYDVSSKDGVLCLDADRDAISGENARELFGTETDLDGDGRPDGYPDGFAALAAFVAKARREGILSPQPAADGWLEERDLTALDRRYGLRMRVGSLRAKAIPLKDAGVTRIRLSAAAPRRIRNFDLQGNDLMRQEGAIFTRANGSLGVYEDIWFRATTPRTVRAWAMPQRLFPAAQRIPSKRSQ